MRSITFCWLIKGMPLLSSITGSFLRIAMDKSLAAHYYKLSADQGFPRARGLYESIMKKLGDPDTQ
jgi:hypothetical protein